MKILNLHGFMGEADNKNYKALCGILPEGNIISPKLDYMGTAPDDLLEKMISSSWDRVWEAGLRISSAAVSDVPVYLQIHVIILTGWSL